MCRAPSHGLGCGISSYTYEEELHCLGCQFRARNPANGSGFDRYLRGRVSLPRCHHLPLQDRSSSSASVRSSAVLSTSELGHMSWTKSKTITRSLGTCLGIRCVVLAIGVPRLKIDPFSADDFGRVLSWRSTARSVLSHPSAPRPPMGPIWTSTAILLNGTSLVLCTERPAIEFADPQPGTCRQATISSRLKA